MYTGHELRAARARYLSRRWFLRECGIGLAGIAASSLLAAEANAAAPATIRELCDRAVWIHAGVTRREGSPEEVLEAYQDSLKGPRP